MITVLVANFAIISLAVTVAAAVFIGLEGVAIVEVVVVGLQKLLKPFDTLVEFCSSRRCSYSDNRNIKHTPLPL